MAQLLERAQSPTGKTVAELLATSPADVPLSVTPDFSPSHYAKMELPTETSPQVLREHYFRFGYRAGRRSSGLLSMPYIKAQAQLLAVDHPDPLAAYFETGLAAAQAPCLWCCRRWRTRRSNRAFLGLCAAQLANSDLEIVVAAAMPGPMSASFLRGRACLASGQPAPSHDGPGGSAISRHAAGQGAGREPGARHACRRGRRRFGGGRNLPSLGRTFAVFGEHRAVAAVAGRRGASLSI